MLCSFVHFFVIIYPSFGLLIYEEDKILDINLSDCPLSEDYWNIIL